MISLGRSASVGGIMEKERTLEDKRWISAPHALNETNGRLGFFVIVYRPYPLRLNLAFTHIAEKVAEPVRSHNAIEVPSEFKQAGCRFDKIVYTALHLVARDIFFFICVCLTVTGFHIRRIRENSVEASAHYSAKVTDVRASDVYFIIKTVKTYIPFGKLGIIGLNLNSLNAGKFSRVGTQK